VALSRYLEGELYKYLITYLFATSFMHVGHACLHVGHGRLNNTLLEKAHCDAVCGNREMDECQHAGIRIRSAWVQ